MCREILVALIRGRPARHGGSDLLVEGARKRFGEGGIELAGCPLEEAPITIPKRLYVTLFPPHDRIVALPARGGALNRLVTPKHSSAEATVPGEASQRSSTSPSQHAASDVLRCHT